MKNIKQREIKLAEFTVPYHKCSGVDCFFCKYHGKWTYGSKTGKAIDRMFK